MSIVNTHQAALSVLMGKKLAIWRRAAEMLILHFGQVTRDQDKSWGEYALHVQCPWRLLKEDVIFAGNTDLFTHKERLTGPAFVKWCEDGDWPDNLLEHRLQSVLKGYDSITRSLENVTQLFVVEKVQAFANGDATLWLSGGYVWECFANRCEGEHWRIFDNKNEESKHYVLSGKRSSATDPDQP